MATIDTEKTQWKFDFTLKRDDETTTRSLTVDNPKSEAAGLSSAIAFRDLFIGQGTETLPTSIVPTQFFQPTGWRDNDSAEPPWTTTACSLKRITTQTTTYDGGGGSSDTIELDYDPDEAIITIAYSGEGTPKAFKDSTELTLQAGATGYWLITNVTAGNYYIFGGGDAKALTI